MRIAIAVIGMLAVPGRRGRGAVSGVGGVSMVGGRRGGTHIARMRTIALVVSGTLTLLLSTRPIALIAIVAGALVALVSTLVAIIAGALVARLLSALVVAIVSGTLAALVALVVAVVSRAVATPLVSGAGSLLGGLVRLRGAALAVVSATSLHNWAAEGAAEQQKRYSFEETSHNRRCFRLAFIN